ncbi:MAG: hypothetical protein H6945_07550 [Zoogloeaceae bacterium]|nr:hypothetical protein [Rhodocyclaceae bacterium]MCP5235577.1 hypothetical protein [Zoogloeaceae bacterium]
MKLLASAVALLLLGPPAHALDPRQAIALGERIRVVAELHDFNASEHALYYCTEERLCLVDGYPVFGTSGTMPKVGFKQLVAVIDNIVVALDHRGMFNPWSPIDREALQFSLISNDDNGVRIRGEFSDGTAAYVAEWLLVGGVSARVRLDCTGCLPLTPSPSPSARVEPVSDDARTRRTDASAKR